MPFELSLAHRLASLGTASGGEFEVKQRLKTDGLLGGGLLCNSKLRRYGREVPLGYVGTQSGAENRKTLKRNSWTAWLITSANPARDDYPREQIGHLSADINRLGVDLRGQFLDGVVIKILDVMNLSGLINEPGVGVFKCDVMLGVKFGGRFFPAMLHRLVVAPEIRGAFGTHVFVFSKLQPSCEVRNETRSQRILQRRGMRTLNHLGWIGMGRIAHS